MVDVSHPAPVRVLVVDDSAFARKVFRAALSADPRLQVVDTARDGLEAVEKIARLRPDVVTLDLVMPNLDGLGVLDVLAGADPAVAPRVVIVSTSDSESELGLAALSRGAVDLVHKPTALATERLYELSGDLVAKVLAAAGARVPPPLQTLPEPLPAPPPSTAATATELVVIGASTGGPQALTRLLCALPGDLPAPVAVALHIPSGYTAAMASRLDQSCAVTVREADDGDPLQPGHVYIAPGGQHLTIARRDGTLVAQVGHEPIDSLYHPSVDALFASAARATGGRALGVVLTGMGDDGLQGARALRDAGGLVLAEAESSCIVYGMPRRVREEGVATVEAPIDAMAGAIVRHL